MKHLVATALSALIVTGQSVFTFAIEPTPQKSNPVMPEFNEAASFASQNAVANQNQIVEQRPEYSFVPNAMLPADLKNAVTLEANYITAAQFKSAGHPANGAINNVLGAPTWVVPRENALAILGLIESAEITGNTSYLNAAALAIGYLSRVQDSDGAWFDQYDHQNVVVSSKSPTQTAEVMIAYYKFGYDSSLYASMKKAAQYLLACQAVANKKGQNDGLLGGGKDANGVYSTTRWTSDNAFAYQAFKAAQAWAAANGDAVFASRMQTAAQQVLNGINKYLYNGNPSDDDYGVWKRSIDQNGVELEPSYHEWINYAPQMLDLPAAGVGSVLVGNWIHKKFQKSDGSVVWDDGPHSARKSPGFSFQASLAWQDIGQKSYANSAINWAVNSGLWKKTSTDGAAGGWVDWTEPADQVPSWQRFIDTSFYSIVAFRGGYNFNIRTAAKPDILAMKLQDNDAARADFNLMFGTRLKANGNISAADKAILQQVANSRAYNYDTFFGALTKTAALYRAIQSSSTHRADLNLMYGLAVGASGAPNAEERDTFFNIAGSSNFDQTKFLLVLRKSSSLYSKLQRNAAKRYSFNRKYGARIWFKGSPCAPDRAVIFGITSAPSYNENTFWASL